MGKYAYLIGGLSDEGPNGTASVLDSLMRYDTETGAMLEMATMLAPRCGGRCEGGGTAGPGTAALLEGRERGVAKGRGQ